MVWELINKQNYAQLSLLAEKIKQQPRPAVGLYFDFKPDALVKFDKIKPLLYGFLDYEEFFFTTLKNIPYCILSLNAVDHIDNSLCRQGEKTTRCQTCRFFRFCPGFPRGYFKKFGVNELKPMLDLPAEVMIEIEPNCNLSCGFCFNKRSFAKNGRNIEKITFPAAIKIIGNIKRAGIKIIRFTGGEPLLNPRTIGLMAYAKSKKLEVRLNTNGSLINKAVATKLTGIVDNILIPIVSWSDREEAKITGVKNCLRKKISAIKILEKAGIPIVRAGTVATKNNIRHFWEIYELILALPVDEWELYRPVSASSLTTHDLEALASKISKTRQEDIIPVSLANAVPFCALKNLNKLNAISTGALYDEGHSRMVIDARGFCKPDYFLDKNIGRPDDILNAWNNPFMKKIRHLRFVPGKCKKCLFVLKCRGGSRFAAKLSSGKLEASDPLANYNNLKNFNKSLK